jgi:hypothetical protein
MTPPENRFDLFCEQAPVGFTNVLKDLRFCAASQALPQMLGYSCEEFVSKTFAAPGPSPVIVPCSTSLLPRVD